MESRSNKRPHVLLFREVKKCSDSINETEPHCKETGGQCSVGMN